MFYFVTVASYAFPLAKHEGMVSFGHAHTNPHISVT